MLSTLVMLYAVLPAQHAAAQTNNINATAQRTAAPTGIWPTAEMINHVLARWADHTAGEYDLTPEQFEALNQQLNNRWPQFFEQQRSALQPLLNEFIETRLAPTPPDSENVKNWSMRALPVFRELQQQLLETHRELSGILSPSQQAKLAGDSLKATAVLQAFHARLEAWQRGEFAQHEWWDPPRRTLRRRIHDAESRSAKGERAAGAKPGVTSVGGASSLRGEAGGRSLAEQRIDEELVRWEFYVAEFTERFLLDAMQRETAYSILRECERRALDHLGRFHDRIERVEKEAMTRQPLTEEDCREIVAVYGPIDEIFSELRARLAQIPTQAQSAVARPPDSAGATPTTRVHPILGGMPKP